MIRVYDGTNWQDIQAVHAYEGGFEPGFQEIKRVHVWDGSSWVLLWEPVGWLYDYGTEHVPFVLYTGGASYGNYSFEKEWDHLYLSAEGSFDMWPMAAQGTFGTEYTQDLSPYSTLEVTWNITTWPTSGAGADTRATLGAGDATTQVTASTGITTTTLDISALSGFHPVWIQAFAVDRNRAVFIYTFQLKLM